MSETLLRDLKLMGNGSCAGGKFRNVRITGEASITGETECRNLRCMGEFALKGNLKADTMKVTGNSKIEGDLRASALGAMGELEVSGALRSDRLRITGELRVGGNCEAETVEIRGGMHVQGLLNAEKIDIKMHGPSRAEEIGGGTVAVVRSRSAMLKRIFGHGTAPELTAELIEGDTLHLEHTRAAVVRGNRVTLGPGCEIGRVEYRTSLQVGRNAVVAERLQL